MTTIKPGDLVVLKSGGPTMTVRDIGGADKDYATATWFDTAAQQFCERSFRVEQVKVVPSAE